MASRVRAGSRRAASRGLARPRIESLETRTLLNGDAPSFIPPMDPADTVPGAEEPLDAPVLVSITSSDEDVVQIELPPEWPQDEIIYEAMAFEAQPTATDLHHAPGPESLEIALPDLVATRLSAPDQLDWDQDFRVSGSIANQGGAATSEPFKVDIFASPTAATTAESTPLGSFLVPAGLAPGEAHNFDLALRAPGRPQAAPAQGATFHVTLAVDTTNTIVEANEANNGSRALLGVDAVAVTHAPRLPSKLVPAGIQVHGPGAWGQFLRVTVTVRNEGGGTAPPTNARIVLAPYGDDPLGPRAYTIGAVPIPEVRGFQTVSATQNIRLPQFPPSALANIGKFTVMMVNDTDTVENPALKPINYQVPGPNWTRAQIAPKQAEAPAEQLPDIAITALTAPTAMTWDQLIGLQAKLENIGKRDAGAFRVRFGLVQSDDPNAPMLSLGDVQVSGLKAGQVLDLSHSIRLPATAPSGMSAQTLTGKVVARVDAERVLDESRIDNNQLTSPPITLRLLSHTQSTTSTTATTTTTTSPPSSTPTGNVSQPVPAGNVTQPIKTSPAAQRKANILSMQRLLQQQRKLKREQLRAAQNQAKAPKLRIYPRQRQATTPARRAFVAGGTVRILPISAAQEATMTPDRSA